ncbi:MAG: hypothetical protein K6T75_05400 [Acetobacteraceae bacterium]|nr:hypothetical protein [Acetobacteraceae bacterium]
MPRQRNRPPAPGETTRWNDNSDEPAVPPEPLVTPEIPVEPIPTPIHHPELPRPHRGR